MTRNSSWLVPLAAVLLSGCAGTASEAETPAVNGPAVNAGHGSVEEVGAVLERQGVPCTEARTLQLDGTEQAVECLLHPMREQVLIVHFISPRHARAFEQRTRESGGHGVYARSWGAQTESRDAAELIARAVISDSWS